MGRAEFKDDTALARSTELVVVGTGTKVDILETVMLAIAFWLVIVEVYWTIVVAVIYVTIVVGAFVTCIAGAPGMEIVVVDSKY